MGVDYVNITCLGSAGVLEKITKGFHQGTISKKSLIPSSRQEPQDPICCSQDLRSQDLRSQDLITFDFQFSSYLYKFLKWADDDDDDDQLSYH